MSWWAVFQCDKGIEAVSFEEYSKAVKILHDPAARKR
jgi:hypothetical protein